MKLMSSVIFCLLLLVLFQGSSCNHHIDKVIGERKVQVMQGSMTFYPDSNILIYRSHVGLKMDNEILKPKPFYAKLPKGLKWYSMTNSQSFVFYYSHQQAIAINIDLSNNVSQDTVYQPTEAELNNFINSISSHYGKYDIRKVKFNAQRKQRIIKKEAATILLYNITSENFSEFSEYMEGFQFL